MSLSRRCEDCGTMISAESTGGFCAQCLLALGLEPPDPAQGANPFPLEGEAEKPAPPTHARITEKPGDRIGRYKLLQEIGSGGCGVVYMAEQEEPVHRRVALKVIKLGMDTRQVVARFGAERQALALMDHPNIAKVLDAGATETGRPYFVMELVGGVKITQYCDEHHLTTAERLELYIQVCRAIQHAHQKGIIHRDIKPSNVLVTQHDGTPVPKVIDFGIAKATQGKLTDQTLFTAFEQFIGTPVYMSPEQAELGGLDVDTRSDIYSLGVLLYELLTGKTPFDEKQASARGFEALRRTILDKEPMRPSTRLSSMLQGELTATARQRQIDPPKLVNLLRGDLDWIVMKCLEKDRSRRYETANGLARDVQRYLNQEPVVARPPNATYRIQKFIRRNKLAALSAAAISVVMVFGITISTWQAIKAWHAEREQSRLRAEAQSARQDATEKLWSSYLAEARARRISGVAGLRFESLAAIRKAAAIKPSLELRNEAIASMVLTDVRWVKEKDFSRRAVATCDRTLEQYAVTRPGGTLSIRRVSDDVELRRLPAVGVRLAGIWIFSPDGKLLGVFYADDRLRLWDCNKAEIVLEMQGVQGSDFTPDSSRLATVEKGNIVLYDLTAKPASVPPRILPFEPGPWHLLFHPGGHLLAAYTEARSNLLVMDIESGKTVMVLPHPKNLLRIAWHPDGKHLATTCSDNLIHIWDTTTGQHTQSLAVDQVVSVGFNRRGNLLVSGGWDGKMRLWDFANNRQLVSIYRAGAVNFFGPDDQGLVCGHWDGTGLDFFEVANGEGLRTIYQRDKEPQGAGGTVIFSNNGKILAYQTSTGTKLWDATAGRELDALDGEEVNLFGFDAGDRNLIISSNQGLLRWPIKQLGAEGAPALGAPVRLPVAIPGHGGLISADGKTCVVVGGDRAEIFDTGTFGEPVRTAVQPGMRFVTLTPDGSLLASGAWHYPGVIVWDTKTGKPIKELPTDDEATTVAFTPDGRQLVASTLHDYRFFEVGSWSPVLRIPQPTGNDFAATMAFSRDGKVFAGTHSRSAVRLFDAKTGQILADLESPDSKMVTSLCFNADGNELAMGEGMGAVRIWDLRLIRERLAGLGLDWNAPAYESNHASARDASQPSSAPLPKVIHSGPETSKR